MSMDRPVAVRPLITPEQAQHFAKAMAEFGRAVREQLIEPMLRAARTMHIAVWNAYRAAGMPYGETEAGMMRWFGERSAAARVEREREYEAERVGAVASFAARHREMR